MARNLPAGWEERFDPTHNRPYYVNHNSRSTTWYDPQIEQLGPPPPYQPEPLASQQQPYVPDFNYNRGPQYPPVHQYTLPQQMYFGPSQPYQQTSYYSPNPLHPMMASQHPNYCVPPPSYPINPSPTQQYPSQPQSPIVAGGGVKQQMPSDYSIQQPPYKSPTFDSVQSSNVSQPYNVGPPPKADTKVENRKNKNSKLKQGLAVAGAAGAGLIGGFLAGEAVESTKERFEDLRDSVAQLERENEERVYDDDSDDYD